jgi:hypothetical protein
VGVGESEVCRLHLSYMVAATFQAAK